MLKNGYYSQGHSDRTPRSSKMFRKGIIRKSKNYKRSTVGKGKIYTKESIWAKSIKLLDKLIILSIVGTVVIVTLTYIYEIIVN